VRPAWNSIAGICKHGLLRAWEAGVNALCCEIDGPLQSGIRHCEQGAASPSSNRHFDVQTYFRVPAARFARVLLSASRSRIKGAGKARCRPAPTVRCARVAQKELHSGIQVKPNTRPSLRDGRTAYAVISREPNSFWPPSPYGSYRHRAGWRRCRIRKELGRSDDGRDHTVLPYARSGAVRTTRLARRSRGSAQSIAPPCTHIRDGAARVHRDLIRGS